jgi:DNA topoisomerase-1
VGKFEEQDIELFDGKYGMYLKWGKVNATVPKELDVEKLTLEQAIEIVKARAEIEKPAKKSRKKKK